MVPITLFATRPALGTPAITLLVVAAAAPLTVMGGAVPVGLLLGNGIGFPAMFLVSAAILLLFSVGMIRMSREVPHTSSFFGFIAHGLNAAVGTGAAWLAVVCYSAVQFAVFAYLGDAISASLAGIGGPELPWWLFSLIAVVVVGLLSFRRIEFSSRVLGVVLIAEMAIVVALAVSVMARGGADGLSLAPFSPAEILSGSPALGLMFALAGFIGFESTVVFRSEAKNPDQTIRRATMAAATIIGLFYAFGSWAIVMAWGTSSVIDVAAEEPALLLSRTADDYLGPVGSVLVTVLLLGSMFACVLGLNTVVARYLKTMSTSRLLPAPLARLHPRHGGPSIASTVQAAVAGLLIVIGALSGIPAALLFAWFAGVGTLIIVILMVATSVAVMRYFLVHRRGVVGPGTYLSTVVAAIALTLSAMLIAANFPLLVGDVDDTGAPTFGFLSAALLVVIVLVAVGGMMQALVLRSRRPEAYRAITSALDMSADGSDPTPRPV